jgi:CelD/BcsL family acetyltransferase involved in cellulose biosynthesis
MTVRTTTSHPVHHPTHPPTRTGPPLDSGAAAPRNQPLSVAVAPAATGTPPCAGTDAGLVVAGDATTPKATAQRAPNAGDLEVRVVTDLNAAEGLADDWLELYRSSDLGNPNLHPQWVLAWYRTFVPAQDVVLVTVHAGDRLVGIAPLWRMRLLPGTAGPSTLQPAGAGRHVLLSDTPGVLSAAHAHRKVVKAVADRLATVAGWSWLTLTLSPEQGWSDQLSTPGETCVVPRVGRTCVISELPPTVAAFESALKRNVRESIRRSRNRLKKADSQWSLRRTRPADPGFEKALADLVALHQQRAQLPGHKRHANVFDDPRYAAFLFAVASTDAARDLMTIYHLQVGDRVLAAQLVVHAPGTSMLLTSGMHPDGWDLSPMALITKEIICDEIVAGRSRLNHSAGPDTGKLRWSEALVTHAEFSVVRTPLLHRAAFLAYSHLAVGAGLRRERTRHRPAPAGAAAR